MCLLIIAHGHTPDYPLVVAANRDEFHRRPTAPSAFWQDQPKLLAGRDLEQGGTWMGVTRSGRFAAVTNFRDPDRTAPAPRSRGELPTGFLAGSMPPGEYLAGLAAVADEYAGFNLLVGDGTSLWYYSNDGPHARPRRLEPGIYGLSNARLDTPWPKSEGGKVKLARLLEAGAPDHDTLARVVADRQTADPSALELQGMDSTMEQLLSAQFIVMEDYGTRSSTSMWIDGHGALSWREQSFDNRGELRATREEHFPVSGDGTP